MGFNVRSWLWLLAAEADQDYFYEPQFTPPTISAAAAQFQGCKTEEIGDERL